VVATLFFFLVSLWESGVKFADSLPSRFLFFTVDFFYTSRAMMTAICFSAPFLFPFVATTRME